LGKKFVNTLLRTKNPFYVNSQNHCKLYRGDFNGINVAVKEVSGIKINLLSIKREKFAASILMKDDEAANSRNLQNILFCYIDVATDSFIICSEYCDGGTLVDLLSNISKCTYSFFECLDIFIGILNGVAILHRLGLAHNDIKSSNILIKKDPLTGIRIPVLADYGCMDPVEISSINKATMTQALKTSRLLPYGTPVYRDPCNNSNKTIHLKCDLFRYIIFSILPDPRPLTITPCLL
jgi:serine/threonine protein kinase